MSDKIAFIGIGNMGLPMAKNLMNAGKKVKVFDVSNESIDKAKNENLDVAENIDSLINQDLSFVITMLPEGKNSEEVYLGENGIIKKVSKDCLLIDCSTIDIETSIKIGKKANQEKIKMIDAPVSGGVMGAKICNNMSLGITMIAASESLMLAKRLNIDVKKVHEIMKSASGNSWPISVYPPVPGLIEGTPSNNNYRPGFSTAMMTKDLKLANQISKSVKANTPLGEKALKIYNDFCEKGYAKSDFSAISKLIGDEVWNYSIDKIEEEEN